MNRRCNKNDRSYGEYFRRRQMCELVCPEVVLLQNQIDQIESLMVTNPLAKNVEGNNFSILNLGTVSSTDISSSLIVADNISSFNVVLSELSGNTLPILNIDGNVKIQEDSGKDISSNIVLDVLGTVRLTAQDNTSTDNVSYKNALSVIGNVTIEPLPDVDLSENYLLDISGELKAQKITTDNISIQNIVSDVVAQDISCISVHCKNYGGDSMLLDGVIDNMNAVSNKETLFSQRLNNNEMYSLDLLPQTIYVHSVEDNASDLGSGTELSPYKNLKHALTQTVEYDVSENRYIYKLPAGTHLLCCVTFTDINNVKSIRIEGDSNETTFIKGEETWDCACDDILNFSGFIDVELVNVTLQNGRYGLFIDNCSWLTSCFWKWHM